MAKLNARVTGMNVLRIKFTNGDKKAIKFKTEELAISYYHKLKKHKDIQKLALEYPYIVETRGTKINKQKLYNLITIQGDNWTIFAKKFGLSPHGVSYRLKTGFSFSEVAKIKEIYNLTDEQIYAIS